MPCVYKSDKEIEQDTTAYIQRLMSKQKLAPSDVNVDILNILFQQIEDLQRIVGKQDASIKELLEKQRIFENRIQKNEKLAYCKADNEKNVLLLKKMFNLSDSVNQEENPLEKMKGLLEEYSKRDEDAVAILNETRGE
jgi:hypothetical protein